MVLQAACKVSDREDWFTLATSPVVSFDVMAGSLFVLPMVLFLGATGYPTASYQYDPPLPPPGISRPDFQRWLEARPRPKLTDPDARLSGALNAHFGWGADVRAKVAVVGPPRVTGIAWPKFYVWLVATEKNGKIVGEGAMRLALVEDERESRVDVLSFVPKAEMGKQGALEAVFPWDAIILIKKFL